MIPPYDNSEGESRFPASVVWCLSPWEGWGIGRTFSIPQGLFRDQIPDEHVSPLDDNDCFPNWWPRLDSDLGEAWTRRWVGGTEPSALTYRLRTLDERDRTKRLNRQLALAEGE